MRLVNFYEIFFHFLTRAACLVNGVENCSATFQLRNGEDLLLQKPYLLVISTGMSKEMFRILEQPLRVKSPATDLDIFKAFAPWTLQIKT